MKRGTATKDKSPFGCRDMAGNGYEWTGKDSDSSNEPLKRPPMEKLTGAEAYLRGQSYLLDSPLSNAMIAEGGGAAEGKQVKENTGFRVVLEP